jgi:ATP/maltotriose-dependent transcriptional regulator MalT
LSTLEDALQTNPEELIFQPNILTRRGELRLKTGHLELAEADFREAIDRAQKMTAKALELRAATGLARMLRARGDRAAARDLLAPVYNWFAEGSDTADPKDAKALLAELGNSP